MIIFGSNSSQKVSSPWYLRRDFKIIVTLTLLLIISFITTYLLIMRDKEQVRKEEANANIIITLRTFYYKTNGDNWIVSTGWNDENDLNICGWYGIICEDSISDENDEDHNLPAITSLLLSGNNLAAEKFDGSDLISITLLNEIDLSSNQLIGDISAVTENLLQLPLISVVNLLYNSGLTGRVSHVVCDYDQGHIFKVDCDIKCECCDRSSYCTCVDDPDFIDINGNNCEW